MMTDPIADMLTRIRNAVRIERPIVEMPVSKVKRGLAEVLKREGYIWDWQEIEATPGKQLRLASAQRLGNHDSQHEPWRRQRPRSPQAESRRRDPLRIVVVRPLAV
jgi:ribosomal protein S8